MTIVPGKVIGGRVEVEDFELPEGADVGVVIPARDSEEYIPTEEEAAEIEAGFDELERGESVPLEDVMREIRALRSKEERRRR
jgi:hypothetical protein